MAVTLSISITQNSQSTANNTSNVTVKATAKWTNGSNNRTGQCTGSITIDGTKYSFSGITFNDSQTTSGSKVVMSKTVNVSHNSDGTKTLSCSASFVTGVSSGTISASASKTLTTIPRKSTLTVENGTLGTAQTLTITEQASAFVHKLKYDCGDASGWILGGSSATSATLSTNWTPPLSLAQQNTTGTSVSVTFTLYTYSGSTLIGSNTYTKTFSIPSSVKPTVSIAVSDEMGHASEYGYIQGQSKLKVVVTASGSQGSTIKSYSTTADGKTYTAATFTTDFIVGNGVLTIKTTVKDSRGRTATASQNINVWQYAIPKITAISCKRCNADGSANSAGNYIAVTFSTESSSVDGMNSISYVVKYKKVSATSYTSTTLTDYAGKHSVSAGVCIIPAETSSSYDIKLTVTDSFKSVSKDTVGVTVKKVWSMLKKAGEIVGISFGKIAELEGVFDVDFVIRARKGIIVDTEWVDLSIADGFALYSGTVSNQPKCKITGNVVTVMGILSPTAEFTSSTTGVNIASGIPANMRPSVNLQFVCQGSSMNRWDCSVTTSGTVTISRYGTTEATTVPVGAWLPFCVTYQI